MQSKSNVVIKCLHRFDILQFLLYSRVGVGVGGSPAVASLFSIAVTSPGDLVMINILLLYF